MLSIRMRAVADLVTDGLRVADIGTDHGFVPIALVSEGRCPSAIAADVRSGPLSHAAENIRKQGLSDVIETRLSDGLKKIDPGEAEAVIIAGMGGMLMIRILEDGQDVISAARELILQPQSDIPQVRRWLNVNGFHIICERIALDAGKYYFMMKAVPGKGPEYDAADEQYGYCLLNAGDRLLQKYLEEEAGKLKDIRQALIIQTTEKSRQRLKEIDLLQQINFAAQERNQKALDRRDGSDDSSGTD